MRATRPTYAAAAAAFPPELLVAVDLVVGDIATIRNILAAYDQTNAMALMALSMLLCRLGGLTFDPEGLGTKESLAEPPFSIPLPPLPSLPSCRSRSASWF